MRHRSLANWGRLGPKSKSGWSDVAEWVAGRRDGSDWPAVGELLPEVGGAEKALSTHKW